MSLQKNYIIEKINRIYLASVGRVPRAVLRSP